MKRQCFAVAFATLSVLACATQPVMVEENGRPWLQSLIANLQQEPVANPPASITKYTYRSAPVYYLSARCCDITSKLYDVEGKVICEPDGGLTGKGDGRCTDFIAARSDERLVWKDDRH